MMFFAFIMMCLFVFHSKMPHLQAAENAFLQTACKITKNIGFNIFYGIINFIQKARFNNSAAQKKEKRLLAGGASGVTRCNAAICFSFIFSLLSRLP
jgi:hypothetical protein